MKRNEKAVTEYDALLLNIGMELVTGVQEGHYVVALHDARKYSRTSLTRTLNGNEK